MSDNKKISPVAVVAGAGAGNGQALAKRFSDAGYAVALLARNLEQTRALANELPNAKAYACDVGNKDDVSAAFATIQKELGAVEVLLFNAGSGIFADVESITPEQFESAWRVNAFGALLCAQQVIPAMKARKKAALYSLVQQLRVGVAPIPPHLLQLKRHNIAWPNRWRVNCGQKASMFLWW